jgi:DNA-binding transcriptional ArsR family regulator
MEKVMLSAGGRLRGLRGSLLLAVAQRAAAGPKRRKDAVFAALGDPVRRRVLERLSRGGTVTASGIAAKLPISRQAVAKHLAALRDADLVTSDRVGRETRYALRLEPLDDAARWIQTVSAGWDDRLEALRRSLEKRIANTSTDVEGEP